MSRRLAWCPSPVRLFQVFDRQHRSQGCWSASAESVARAELRKHRGGYLLLIDEYAATLPHLGHVRRVVVGRAA